MSLPSSIQYDFPPHSISTTCLQLGKKNEKLLVTGGDDRRVNLWSIGHTAPISLLSLSGHASAISCVGFDGDEHYVVAGSAGGTIKLWDLAHQKVIRTLLAHRNSVDVVQYHPFGDYFASSSEREVKVWDVRRKGCIHSFQEPQVRPLQFSPDGKWILTASPLSTSAKLWDLTAGKLLHTFQHPSPVSQILFHPEELILCCVLTDGNVWFWDMDAWTCISNSHSTSTSSSIPSKFSIFHPAGQYTLSLSKDQCSVYEWETLQLIDSMELQWHAVSMIKDATITRHNQLIAASFAEVMVSIFQLDLTSLLPFRTGSTLRYTGSESALSSSFPSPAASFPSKSYSLPSSLQSSYSSLSNLPLLPPIAASTKKADSEHEENSHVHNSEDDASSANVVLSSPHSSSLFLIQPPPSFPAVSEIPAASASENMSSISITSPGEVSSTPTIPDVEASPLSLSTIPSNREVITASVSVAAVVDADPPSPTPSTPSTISTTTTATATATIGVVSKSSSSSSSLPSTQSLPSSTASLIKNISQISLEEPSNDSLNTTVTARSNVHGKVHVSTSPLVVSAPILDPLLSPTSPPILTLDTTPPPPPPMTQVNPPVIAPLKKDEMPMPHSPSLPLLAPPPSQVSSVSTQITPTAPGVSLGISPMTPPHSPFIPCSGRMPLYLDFQSMVNGCPRASTVPRTGTPEGLSASHGVMVSILTHRVNTLAQIQHQWKRSLHHALMYTQDVRQHAVFIDILRVLRSVPTLLTLDVCVLVLPWLTELLFQALEDYLITACTMIKLILTHFAPLITTTLSAPPPIGVDFSREERIEKCSKCRSELLAIQQVLKELSNTPGALGHLIRDTLNAFPKNGF